MSRLGAQVIMVTLALECARIGFESAGIRKYIVSYVRGSHLLRHRPGHRSISYKTFRQPEILRKCIQHHLGRPYLTLARISRDMRSGKKSGIKKFRAYMRLTLPAVDAESRYTSLLKSPEQSRRIGYRAAGGGDAAAKCL